MAHVKKASKERKGLKKGKKMEAVKPLTLYCTPGVHIKPVIITA